MHSGLSASSKARHITFSLTLSACSSRFVQIRLLKFRSVCIRQLLHASGAHSRSPASMNRLRLVPLHISQAQGSDFSNTTPQLSAWHMQKGFVAMASSPPVSHRLFRWPRAALGHLFLGSRSHVSKLHSCPLLGALVRKELSHTPLAFPVGRGLAFALRTARNHLLTLAEGGIRYKASSHVS